MYRSRYLWVNPEQPYYFNHTTQSAVPENIGDIVEKFYADAKNKVHNTAVHTGSQHSSSGQ